MNVEDLRKFCLSKTGITEGFPFGEDTLVFKVSGKMFALVGLDQSPAQVNLKCEPVRAIDLREKFPDHISGAYHMNKKHWNSLLIQGLPTRLVEELVDHSYNLVVAGLTKKQKEQLISTR